MKSKRKKSMGVLFSMPEPTPGLAVNTGGYNVVVYSSFTHMYLCVNI